MRSLNNQQLSEKNPKLHREEEEDLRGASGQLK
jgi:hypothetical protein